MTLGGVGRVARHSVRSYVRHGDAILGGAIAFFAMMSAAPLAVVAVAMAGVIFGEDAARGVLQAQLEAPLGVERARFIARLMEEARDPFHGRVAAVVGGVVLVFAASRLFKHLHRALNYVMGVRPRLGMGFRKAARAAARRRLIYFGMVLLSGASLALLLMARIVLAALTSTIHGGEANPTGMIVSRNVELAVAFGLLATLFTLIFKYLPDIHIAWRDAAVGAAVTAVFLGLGTLPVGWFFGWVDLTSAYGAAGTLMAILLWAYYSAQIFFLGAEFTRAFAIELGHGLRPASHAVRVVEEDDRPERASVLI